ncbi:MAG: T9SS type A sorting domain-containing protein [Bacteroidetes bacterium]|nr:T9SS type A sorting domain-containing protein [Bacteroidota bacterium]
MAGRILTGMLFLFFSLSLNAQPFGEAETFPFSMEAAGTGNLEFANGFDLADPDGDGDLDLFLYYQEGNQIIFYENKPVNGLPNFSSNTINPFNLLVPEPDFLTFHSFVLEDIDGDNDVDILMGDLLRPFVLIENIGTPNTPEFAAPVSNDFFLEDCSLRPHAFGDVDFDGDLDVLTTVYLGGDASKICLVQNDGSATNPDFLLPGDLSYLGEGDINLGNGDFADFDQDGDADYLHSEVDGNLSYHENISSGDEIAFAEAQINLWGFEKSAINNSTPRLADVDGDGDLDYFELDLFTGELFYRENLSPPVSVEVPELATIPFDLFPNPTETSVRLQAILPSNSRVAQVFVRDAAGRICHWQSVYDPPEELQLDIDLSKLSSGSYLLELQTDQATFTKALIKSH